MTEDSITYIGTATALLKINSTTILLDPAFFHGKERVHMGWGLFSKRIVPPAIPLDQIKPDLLMITHTHNDHYDDTAKAGLSKDIPVITNHKAASTIRKDGFTNVTGLRVDKETTFNDITIKAFPARHGPLYMRPFVGHSIGFGLQVGEKKLWISGDTIGYEKLRSKIASYSPKYGIVYFGGVRAYMVRLTLNGKDGRNLLEGTTLQKFHAVHIDDWTHFRTKKEDIVEEFKDSGIEVNFPTPGQPVTLW